MNEQTKQQMLQAWRTAFLMEERRGPRGERQTIGHSWVTRAGHALRSSGHKPGKTFVPWMEQMSNITVHAATSNPSLHTFCEELIPLHLMVDYLDPCLTPAILSKTSRDQYLTQTEGFTYNMYLQILAEWTPNPSTCSL